MAANAAQIPSGAASRAVAMFPQLRRPADPVPWRGPIMRTSEIDAWQQLSREGYELRVPAQSPEGLVGPFMGDGGCLDPVMPEGRIMRWFDPTVPADDGDFVFVRLSDATIEGVLERARALPAWQREAWFKRYGEQPCNLATKWLRHGTRERILCWNTGGMPLGDNQILGVCRYVLLDGEPALGSGPDTVGWSDVATAMQTVEINALETTNGPAQADADETSSNPQPWGWITDDGFQPDDLADVTTEHAAEVIFEASSLPASPEPGWLVYLNSADGGFSADTWLRRNDANDDWIKVGAHDALQLVNAPAEGEADKTQRNLVMKGDSDTHPIIGSETGTSTAATAPNAFSLLFTFTAKFTGSLRLEVRARKEITGSDLGDPQWRLKNGAGTVIHGPVTVSNTSYQDFLTGEETIANEGETFSVEGSMIQSGASETTVRIGDRHVRARFDHVEF